MVSPQHIFREQRKVRNILDPWLANSGMQAYNCVALVQYKLLHTSAQTEAQSNKYTFTFTKISNMITFVRNKCDHVFREAELASLTAGETEPRRYLPPLETHVFGCVFVYKIVFLMSSFRSKRSTFSILALPYEYSTT